jgi:nucleoside-diphosphate-sugar epimerase
MRILVIGGTRFIGQTAVRALADAGHDITIFHRGQTEPDLPASVKHIHCGDASLAFIGWKVQFLPRFIDDFRRIALDVVLDAIRLPPHLIEGIDTQQELLVDSTRIRQELGYNETIPLDEALRRTVAWERANPPQRLDPQQFDYAAEDAVLASLK